MKKISELLKKKTVWALAAVIVFQLALTCYYFVNVKNATFSDEPWSYGVANGFYNGFIYLAPGTPSDGIGEEDIVNWREWIDGDVLHDYITVQEGERFAYGSVYSNSKQDIHPPFYFFLLHTVCSFFPDRFSYWYGFSLNLACIVLVQVFLYKLAKCVMKNERAAIITCAFYAASTGTLSTFIYVRLYALLTLLTVAFTYYNARLYSEVSGGEGKLMRCKLPIAVSAFLLFSTNYTVIAYAGILTLCMCIYMIFKKRIKEMFVYGFSVLIPLILFVITFPRVIENILIRGNNVSDGAGLSNVTFKIRMFLGLLLQRSIAFKVSVYESSTDDIILSFLAALVILMLPLCFLFRNEEWFKKLAGNVKAKLRKIPSELRGLCYFPLFTVIASAVTCIMLAKIVKIMIMGYDLSTRYVMMLMPVVAAAFVSLLYMIAGRLPKVKNYRNVIAALAVAVDVVYMWTHYPVLFTFRHFDGYRDVSELVKGENCLVICSDCEKPMVSSWEMVEYLGYTHTADKVFFTPGRWAKLDIDKIKENNVRYVFIRVTDLARNNEQLRDISWISEYYEEKDKIDEEASLHFETDDEMREVLSMETENVDYDTLIRSLNGGSDYEVLFGMDIQNKPIAVLELKSEDEISLCEAYSRGE